MSNTLMKKKALWFVPAACAVAMAAIMTAEYSRLKEGDLFEANVEALSDDESIFNQPIWVVYHREDGGMNCTRGGEEKC